jgi:anti-anti-sigma factor
MLPHKITRPRGEHRFSARIEGGYIIAALSGELDIACTPVLREQLLGVLRPRTSRLVIDLSKVSFCDASGLVVLIGTGRRARLLGGVLRLADPAPSVATALHASGLLRQFDIFSTVAAATAQTQTRERGPRASAEVAACLEAASTGSAQQAALTGAAPDARDLHDAVTALLAHADAWRDADSDRRFTSPIRALARAHARDDHTALAKAVRSLLITLTRYPLTYSPAVAETASDLRHLIGSSSLSPALS